MTGFLQKHVVQPLVTVLKSGITVEKLAWSLAIGLVCGVFPIPGLTSVVAFLPIYLFKLNLVAVQLVNQFATPINLATFIPFIRFGERLLGSVPIDIDLNAFKADPLGAMQRFSGGFARGVFAWALFAVPAAMLLFVVFRPVVRTLMPKQQPQQGDAAAAGTGAGAKKD